LKPGAFKLPYGSTGFNLTQPRQVALEVHVQELEHQVQLLVLVYDVHQTVDFKREPPGSVRRVGSFFKGKSEGRSFFFPKKKRPPSQTSKSVQKNDERNKGAIACVCVCVGVVLWVTPPARETRRWCDETPPPLRCNQTHRSPTRSLSGVHRLSPREKTTTAKIKGRGRKASHLPPPCDLITVATQRTRTRT
jgi:hypothetical protein